MTLGGASWELVHESMTSPKTSFPLRKKHVRDLVQTNRATVAWNRHPEKKLFADIKRIKKSWCILVPYLDHFIYIYNYIYNIYIYIYIYNIYIYIYTYIYIYERLFFAAYQGFYIWPGHPICLCGIDDNESQRHSCHMPHIIFPKKFP